MFVKIVSKINHDGNHYYVTVVSPESKIQQIATSDHPLIEGMTYRANPKMHWVSHRDYEPELAHFRIYGKQTPMEQTA
jgi:hypothetical protein